MSETPAWTVADEALRWLNEVEQAQGGANGPTIKLRAAILAIGEPVRAEICALPENATEPMQKAMQRAVMLRKSMNDVWRAALVDLPEPTAAEAEAMMRTASNWLESNAPETLRAMLRATSMAAENNQMREELRWYGQGATSILTNMLAGDEKAVLANVEILALDGGKRAAKFCHDA